MKQPIGRSGFVLWLVSLTITIVTHRNGNGGLSSSQIGLAAAFSIGNIGVKRGGSNGCGNFGPPGGRNLPGDSYEPDGGDNNKLSLFSSGLFLLSSSDKTTQRNDQESKSSKSGLPFFFFRLPKLPSNPLKRKQEEPDLPPTITSIRVTNSTTLPSALIQHAAIRSNLIPGNNGKNAPPSTNPQSAISEFAKILQDWYTKQGYVLNAVTNANIDADGVCTITVSEPKVCDSNPLELFFAKEVVVDPEDPANVITRRDLRKRETRLKKIPTDIAKLNSTFVLKDQQKTNRNNPKWSKALGLKPGSVFCWDERKWQNCFVRSGVFNRVLKATPVRMEDGSAQLQVIVEEGACRSLEYGLTKSLYTGSWEGELDFEHRNVLGAGEKAGIVFRRGAKDPEPSIRIHFDDDKFGMEGAYETELFNDYIGDNSDSSLDDKEDSPLLRRGGTIRWKRLSLFQRSAVKLGLETISTKKGMGESIVSGIADAGPYLQGEGGKVRQSWSVKCHSGARVSQWNDLYSSKENAGKVTPLFGGIGGTLRHIIPIAEGGAGKDIQLAFEHKAGSYLNMPNHESKAVGIGAKVRGYPNNSHGKLKSFLVGSTEIRLPFTLPKVKDFNAVVWGDWIVGDTTDGYFHKKLPRSSVTKPKSGFWANRGGSDDDNTKPDQPFSEKGDHTSETEYQQMETPINGMFRKASVGIGFRKSYQGIPLKYDLFLTKEGNVGAFVGIGRDFDIQ